MKNTNDTYQKKLNIEAINDSVPGKVYYFETTKSTNLEAKLCQDAPDKSLFIAEKQEAGRGRLGRSWSSPAEDGIWMSIYLEPKIPTNAISQLTLLAGIAVSRIIPNTTIKWPNDIILSGKKVCGILTETRAFNGEVSGVIVGIGINVNNQEFPQELVDKATSLYLETKNFFCREQIISDILSEFFRVYDEFVIKGFDFFYDEYVNKCITLGHDVVIVTGDEKSIAKAVGLTHSGELVVETELGRTIVNSGEVSVRGLLGYC